MLLTWESAAMHHNLSSCGSLLNGSLGGWGWSRVSLKYISCIMVATNNVNEPTGSDGLLFISSNKNTATAAELRT
jgi:hypothetical protein